MEGARCRGISRQAQGRLPAAPDSTQRWAGSIGLAVLVSVAYLLAARLSLALLSKPMAWPCSGRLGVAAVS